MGVRVIIKKKGQVIESRSSAQSKDWTPTEFPPLSTLYGGVAKSYSKWTILEKPFKDGESFYVIMKNPLSKEEKKVRWYYDDEHFKNMPFYQPPRPLWKVYRLQHPDEPIHIASKQIDSEWRYCDILGGIWYCPEHLNSHPKLLGVKKMSWADFAKEGAKKFSSERWLA